MERFATALLAFLISLPLYAADKEKPPPDRDDHELEIGNVQKAAARAAGLDLHAASSLKRRAANAAWLPEVTVRVKKESFANDGEKYNTDAPYQVFTAGEGLFFEVGARWALDGLFFDRREVDASNEAAAVFDGYRRLMEEVGRLYFARKAMMAELATAGIPGEQAAAKRLKLDETTAMLDALCGGCLSREAAKKMKRSEEAK